MPVRVVEVEAIALATTAVVLVTCRETVPNHARVAVDAAAEAVVVDVAAAVGEDAVDVVAATKLLPCLRVLHYQERLTGC